MQNIIGYLAHYREREVPLEEPSNEEWEQLEEKVNFIFPTDFKNFYAVARKYYFEGELPSFSGKGSDGMDWSELIERERNCTENPIPENLIPFCGVGNGDYHCFHVVDKNLYNIAYWYADECWQEQVKHLHILADTFSSWLDGYVQDMY